MLAGGYGNALWSYSVLLVALTVWMWLPEESSAQATSTTTTMNATNVTKVCHTSCCDSPQMQVEARLACQEFRKWGMKDKDCILWQINARRACIESCSNCTIIAKAIYDQCLFFLQSHMDFSQAIDSCKVVQSDFEYNGRCESVCNMTVNECYSPAGKKCMRTCGNFQTCECFMWRGVFGQPDSCTGKTILRGYMPEHTKPPVKYSCDHTMEKCKNHRMGRSCGKYKWCRTNMCLLKNVTCKLTDSCQKYGRCEQSTGDCYFTLKDEGTKCSDNLFFTHDDKCEKGKCRGWVDKCLRDNVQCGTTNPCLWEEGTCHPPTGACVFVKHPNGVNCSTDGNRTQDGTCSMGLCRRRQLDKCAGVNCSHLGGHCFNVPTCNKLSGRCEVQSSYEGKRCDDGNKKTFDDMCIEGVCRGGEFSAPMFKELADGLCADKQGNMLQRYFSDVFDQSECESQCAKDPLCVAYSFGYHFCSIYGGARDSHPQVRQWNHFWKLGNLWGDTSSNANEAETVVKHLPSQQKLVCMKKVEYVPPAVIEVRLGHEIAFAILLTMLVCTPGVYILFWKCRQHTDDDVYIWTCTACQHVPNCPNKSTGRPGTPGSGFEPCTCQHVYNSETDHVELGVKEFEDLPDTWKCPRCGAPKSKFKQTDGDGHSVASEGENYQDEGAMENLKEMQAITGGDDVPIISPREGGESNVAMAPAPAIDDDQASDYGPSPSEDGMDAAVPEEDNDDKEPSAVPTDDGSRDPRGEVSADGG